MNTQNTNFPTAPADDEMLNDIRYSKAQQVAESPPYLDVHLKTTICNT